jgi:hypothetical protein
MDVESDVGLLTVFGVEFVYYAYLDIEPSPRKYSGCDASDGNDCIGYDRVAVRVIKVGLNPRRRLCCRLMIDVIGHLVYTASLRCNSETR